MQSAFESFKKEALIRKNSIKKEKANPKDFTDWLYAQNEIVVGLMGK